MTDKNIAGNITAAWLGAYKIIGVPSEKAVPTKEEVGEFFVHILTLIQRPEKIGEAQFSSKK
jgi:hypothetical protein